MITTKCFSIFGNQLKKSCPWKLVTPYIDCLTSEIFYFRRLFNSCIDDLTDWPVSVNVFFFIIVLTFYVTYYLPKNRARYAVPRTEHSFPNPGFPDPVFQDGTIKIQRSCYHVESWQTFENYVLVDSIQIWTEEDE